MMMSVIMMSVIITLRCVYHEDVGYYDVVHESCWIYHEFILPVSKGPNMSLLATFSSQTLFSAFVSAALNGTKWGPAGDPMGLTLPNAFYIDGEVESEAAELHKVFSGRSSVGLSSGLQLMDGI